MKNLCITYFICFLVFTVSPNLGGNSNKIVKKLTTDKALKDEAEVLFNWDIPKTVVNINDEFYRQNIPSQYAEAFLKATKDHVDYRLILYSMMLLETHHFTYYESHKVNDNGTKDYGPLMLNSANMKNEDFRNKYYPKAGFFDDLNLKVTELEYKYNVYMVACINLFIAHMKTYSKEVRWKQIQNSVRAYNAGPKVLKQKGTRASRRANAYYSGVVNNIEATKIALNQMFEIYKNELDSRVFEVIR